MKKSDLKHSDRHNGAKILKVKKQSQQPSFHIDRSRAIPIVFLWNGLPLGHSSLTPQVAFF